MTYLLVFTLLGSYKLLWGFFLKASDLDGMEVSVKERNLINDQIPISGTMGHQSCKSIVRRTQHGRGLG